MHCFLIKRNSQLFATNCDCRYCKFLFDGIENMVLLLVLVFLFLWHQLLVFFVDCSPFWKENPTWTILYKSMTAWHFFVYLKFWKYLTLVVKLVCLLFFLKILILLFLFSVMSNFTVRRSTNLKFRSLEDLFY